MCKWLFFSMKMIKSEFDLTNISDWCESINIFIAKLKTRILCESPYYWNLTAISILELAVWWELNIRYCIISKEHVKESTTLILKVLKLFMLKTFNEIFTCITSGTGALSASLSRAQLTISSDVLPPSYSSALPSFGPEGKNLIVGKPLIWRNKIIHIYYMREQMSL